MAADPIPVSVDDDQVVETSRVEPDSRQDQRLDAAQRALDAFVETSGVIAQRINQGRGVEFLAPEAASGQCLVIHTMDGWVSVKSLAEAHVFTTVPVAQDRYNIGDWVNLLPGPYEDDNRLVEYGPLQHAQDNPHLLPHDVELRAENVMRMSAEIKDAHRHIVERAAVIGY